MIRTKRTSLMFHVPLEMSFRQKRQRLITDQSVKTRSFPSTTQEHFRMSAQGFVQRCRGACWEAERRLQCAEERRQCWSCCWKMAEAAAVPPHRFFCHCCKGEVNPKLPVSHTLFSVSVYVIVVCSMCSWHVCICLKLRLFCLLATAHAQASPCSISVVCW